MFISIIDELFGLQLLFEIHLIHPERKIKMLVIGCYCCCCLYVIFRAFFLSHSLSCLILLNGRESFGNNSLFNIHHTLKNNLNYLFSVNSLEWRLSILFFISKKKSSLSHSFAYSLFVYLCAFFSLIFITHMHASHIYVYTMKSNGHKGHISWQNFWTTKHTLTRTHESVAQ